MTAILKNLSPTTSGHSMIAWGSKLLLIGGHSKHVSTSVAVRFIELETGLSGHVETSGDAPTPPAPRFDHSAALHADRYLLMFGGCSHATCFNDLRMLDLVTMELSQPEIRGELAFPLKIIGILLVVENGDNRSGFPETLVFNTSILVWSMVTSVEERDPLADSQVSFLDQAQIAELQKMLES